MAVRTSGGTRPVAPWVRTRLRAGVGAALALGVLVAITAFLAAALPRGVDAYENDALRQSLAGGDLGGRSVSVTTDVTRRTATGEVGTVPSPAQLAATDRVLRTVMRPQLTVDRPWSEYGLHTSREANVPDHGLARPWPNLSPTATLLTQRQDVSSQARLVSGRWPSSGSGDRVEAVVTARTAKTLHITAGSTLHLVNAHSPGVTVRVTGIAAPRDPHSAFWNAEPEVDTPALRLVPHWQPPELPSYYWHFTLIVGKGAAGAMLRVDGGAVAFWHEALETGALTAHAVPTLQRRLASLDSGSDRERLRRGSPLPGLKVDGSNLEAELTSFVQEQDAAEPLVLIAAVGIGTVAAVVLLMAAGLTAARRRTELELVRARGGSLTGIAVRLLGETTAVAVPAAAVGTLLALVLVPTGRYTAALLLGAAVAALASLALPVRVAAALRRPRPAGREDVTAVRPSQHRTVAELTAAVILAGAVVSLRHRGTSSGVDVLTAAVPVLLAVGAALVLLRLYPVPLRLLARPVARLNGAVAHLGLARAGRAPATAALPLLAVLVALTVASFGGSVLAGVAAGREHAAVAAVGADARVESVSGLPGGLAARVRRVPGVREVTGVRMETGMGTGADLSVRPFSVVAVDPVPYARLAAHTGLDGGGPLPAAALGRPAGDGPLPAVVSHGLARLAGPDGTYDFDTDSGPVEIRVAAVRDRTPAAGGDFVVVSAAALHRAHPDGDDRAPTALYLTGAHLDGRALTSVVRRAGRELTVDVRARELAGYGGSPLQSGARRVYLAAVAAGAGYSALALLLSLLRGAPQRRAVLARLRTMGMTRRQSQGLVLLETAPPALLGVVGGCLVGLAAVPLLRPDIDLTALAFTAAPHDPRTDAADAVLRLDPASLLLPSAGLLLLACAVLTTQTWLLGRRGEGMDLRMGDRA
jgi:putative ABC transport system permease protein